MIWPNMFKLFLTLIEFICFCVYLLFFNLLPPLHKDLTACSCKMIWKSTDKRNLIGCFCVYFLLFTIYHLSKTRNWRHVLVKWFEKVQIKREHVLVTVIKPPNTFSGLNNIHGDRKHSATHQKHNYWIGLYSWILLNKSLRDNFRTHRNVRKSESNFKSRINSR